MHRTLRWLTAALTACALVAALAGGMRGADDKKADDKKADAPASDPKAVEQALYKALADVINEGADLYNPPPAGAGDQAGCYRLYEGALMALKPTVAHRPEWQKAIDDGLSEARKSLSVGERAFALRKVIDRIRNDINPKKEAAPPAKETLWDRLGGEKSVAKVVDDFVALAAKDAKVNFDRDGKYKLDAAAVADLKKKMVDQISEAAGGPRKYTGKSMKEVHKGMGITDAEFDASVADLKLALEMNGAKPDDIAAVLKVVENTRKDIVEGKKPDEKKPDEKKTDDKKEEKKPDDKKAEEKKPG
jgi:hemoglobin